MDTLKDRRVILFTTLFVLTALWLMIDADNPDKPADPQNYKCKHGNAPAVCLLCYVEKQKPPV